MNNIQKVIILGGNHHNTLGVIRSLGRAGIAPFVILLAASEDSFVLKSRYIQKSWIVKDCKDAIKLLMESFSTERIPSILIACHDEFASILDINRDKLLPFFIIPGLQKKGEITRLMNKITMSDLAAHIGMNVPKSVILNKTNYENNQSISYPCITKPIDSISGSKNEIVVCNNHKELKAFFDNSESNKNYIIQSYILKSFEFQLIGCSLDCGKEIIIPGVSIIIRQSKTSNTGFLHYTQLDDSFYKTVEKTKDFIKSIGFSGLFSVEFLRDKNKIDYFMEMNFRNDGNTIAVANAGVNLPYIWYLHCIGSVYQHEIKNIHDEYVMPEFAELSLYQQGAISRKDWKQDMKKATSYMDYAADDPAPTSGWKEYRKKKFKAQIIRLIKKLLINPSLKKTICSMICKLKNRLQRRYWHLGFAEFDERYVTGEVEFKVRYMKGLPQNKWYADPFILDVTENTIEVLVEELTYSIRRGRIARLSIDRKTLALLSEKIILDLDTHLSFPAIWRENGNVYIYPENSASNSNTYYKYDVDSNHFEKLFVTVEEPLTDAVIFLWQGQKYMFTTRIPEGNSNHLLIFKESESNKYELFQEYYFNDKIARNAGDVLKVGDKYYRVAQDCSKGYGGGVIFQEIVFDNEHFDFKTVHEIFPYPHCFALHTFNVYKGLCVIDVSKARFPMINGLISYTGKIVRKIKR